MKLHAARPSPFVCKVLVLIEEAGRQDEVEILDTAASPVGQNPDLFAKNPLGKIPALVRDDGPALYDSRVILRYLDDRFGTGLYPAPPALWDTLTLEATADGVMDAAVSMVYEKRFRPEEIWSEDWLTGQWGKIGRALDAVEARWLPHLSGPLSIGQIGVGCALGYLDFRHGDRDWRSSRPGLAAWAERFAARPSMQATRPE